MIPVRKKRPHKKGLQESDTWYADSHDGNNEQKKKGK